MPYPFHPFILSSPTPQRPSFSTLTSFALGKNMYLFNNTVTKYRFKKYRSPPKKKKNYKSLH